MPTHGWTSSVFGTIIAAVLYGSEEAEGHAFGFTQAQLDGLISTTLEILAPETFGSAWVLRSGSCRPVLKVSISDAHKVLLLNNPRFISLLIAGLFLDPDHKRKDDTSQQVKQVIQRDYAECTCCHASHH